jgi:DNA topoisomerase-1
LKYVEYDFTANLEDELDDIANGLLNWKNVMRDFWANFSEAVTQMKEIRITEVIDRLEENLEAYLFKDDTERQCKKCNGRLGLRLSKFGAFLGCSNYPECQNRIPILGSQEGVPQNVFETVELGTDPVDKSRITLRNGPYGFYIQVDPSEQAANEGKKKVPKPKRVGLPAGMDPRSVTFDMALLLKELPKTIGTYEDNTISVNTGRFGPYVKCGAVVASIPKSLDFMNISEADAITLIKAKSEKQAKGGKRAAPRRAAPRRGNAAMKVSPIAGEDVTAEMGENATVIAGKKTRAGTGRKTKASAGAAKKTKASARSTSANAKGSSPSGNTRKRKHSPT